MTKKTWLTIGKTLNYAHPVQIVIYLGLFMWGVYSSLRPEPTAVSLMMPSIIYRIWLMLHMLAPVTVWCGQVLVYLLREPTIRQSELGWGLQSAGDTSIFFIAITTGYAFSLSDEPSANMIVASSIGYASAMLLWVLRDAIFTIHYWGTGRRKSADVH